MSSRRLPLLLPFALLLVVGCREGSSSSNDGSSNDGAKTNEVTEVSASKAQPSSEAASNDKVAQVDAAATPVEAIVAEYEVIRAALADDDGASVAAAAQKLAERATKAVQGVSEEQRAHLEKLASAARNLSGKSAGEIAELRSAFGEVSRHLVELVSPDTALKEKLHLFECPMAKGYKKWLQRDAKISNPYMGKKMLECGGPADWS